MAPVTGDSRLEGAIAALIDGSLVDLATAPQDGEEATPVYPDSDAGRSILRHSTAHVMAQAVCDLWPGARLAIGPATDEGFYYDFDLPEGAHFTDDDLARIEARMREIISEDQPFVREEVSRESGPELFSNQPYKREIIEELADGESLSVYRNDGVGSSFVDLCRGPHVRSTAALGHFKLLKVAGSYWRGDEHRQQLQRIYGTAFESDQALANHIEMLAQAEARDHRRLGTELDLFHFPSEIGGGLPVFHPKGALIRTILEDFSRSVHLGGGYQPVWTPHVTRAELYERSGHLGWYSDVMYPPLEMEGAEYRLKPMNCPMHILVYASRGRSYRDLPMRLFELGTVYRFERSGVLHGLARVRGLTQDDAHIFCTPEQLPGELEAVVAFALEVLRTFGLTDFEAELSTRPEKFIGEVADWDHATAALEAALIASGIPYRIAEGEGAFYAPKIDIHLKDAIGRRWQVSTVQVDFQLPTRFDLSYVGADNERHHPHMVHRALFGSVERFMAILIEHYAGALPVWLSPVQVMVLPVKDANQSYAGGVIEALQAVGVRTTTIPAGEPLGARIRKGKLEKIPYILVVGDDDMSQGTVGVNRSGHDKPERGVSLSALVEEVTTAVRNRCAPM